MFFFFFISFVVKFHSYRILPIAGMTAKRPLIFGVAISMVYTVATVVDTPKPIPSVQK